MSLFLDDQIIELITKYANTKMNHVKEKYVRERDCKNTNEIEIRGYIDILLLAGVMKLADQTLLKCLKTTEARSVKGVGIVQELRVDNIEDRQVHAAIDKLVPIK
ncbi:hypothetical protein HHI36_010346 [Cryptolaemus montrouzieri]|uniref:PiggyBac transposable element-derived protein domain-containing protein n=1 Tax=Cryptolaemus montrouzieri TaxID=559131 RepID=A0ABD2MIC7_9CUCU